MSLAWMLGPGPAWFESVVTPSEAIRATHELTQKLAPTITSQKWKVLYYGWGDDHAFRVANVGVPNVFSQVSVRTGRLFSWHNPQVPQSNEMHTEAEWAKRNREWLARLAWKDDVTVGVFGQMVPALDGDEVILPSDSGFGLTGSPGKVRYYSSPVIIPRYPKAAPRISQAQAKANSWKEFLKRGIGENLPYDVKVGRAWTIDPVQKRSIPFWSVNAVTSKPGHAVSYRYFVNAVTGTVHEVNLVNPPSWRPLAEKPPAPEKVKHFHELPFKLAQHYLEILGQSDLRPMSFELDPDGGLKLMSRSSELMKIDSKGRLLEFGPLSMPDWVTGQTEQEIERSSRIGRVLKSLVPVPNNSRIVREGSAIQVRQQFFDLPVLNVSMAAAIINNSEQFLMFRRGQDARGAQVVSRRFLSADQVAVIVKKAAEAIPVKIPSNRDWAEVKPIERGWFFQTGKLLPAWKVKVMWMHDIGRSIRGGGTSYYFSAETGEPLDRFPNWGE